MHNSKEELLQFLPLICQLFKTLGLTVNLEKSQNGSQAGKEIPEVSDNFRILTAGICSRENEENLAGFPSSPAM